MEGEKKLSKKELNKQKKKEAKKAAQAEQGQAEQKDEGEGEVPIGYETDFQFGQYPIVRSERRTDRVWTAVQDLAPPLAGTSVWVRARVFLSRGKGNSCFLVLRDGLHSVQAALFKSDSVPKSMVKFATSIPKESVVDVFGKVATVQEAVASCSQQLVELNVEKLFVVSRAEPCPIQVEDCMRLDPEALSEEQNRQDESDGRPRVALKTRLDNRFLDVRAPINLAIFRVQSGVCTLFREFLLAKGFVEIHTPKILGTASEGGAEVFKVGYFDKDAYLAQSPQLFKQMACVSDFERVFEIAPVFRAEKSFTHRHLTEFMGLDMEMTFYEHYYEVLAVINEMFKYIFNGLEEGFKSELALIRTIYSSEPVQFPDNLLIISFPEAIRMLREHGESVPDLQDLCTEHERLLGRLVKQKYSTDFYVIDHYPKNARPFYTMPAADDPNYTNSYDIFLRGQEISSGAQRVHDAETLQRVAAGLGVDLSPINSYVDSFRYGAKPHGGCGIGLERVVMLYLGLHDIRKASFLPRDPARTSP